MVQYDCSNSNFFTHMFDIFFKSNIMRGFHFSPIIHELVHQVDSNIDFSIFLDSFFFMTNKYVFITYFQIFVYVFFSQQLSIVYVDTNIPKNNLYDVQKILHSIYCLFHDQKMIFTDFIYLIASL